MREDLNLAKGLNVCEGQITYDAVAKAHGYQFSSIVY